MLSSLPPADLWTLPYQPYSWNCGSIGYIFLAAWLFRKEGVYRKNIRSIIPMVVMTLAGFGFAAHSRTGGFSFEDSSLSVLAIGVALALMAALAGSCVVFIFKWGRDLPDKLRNEFTENRSNISLIIFGGTLGFSIVNLAGVILSSGIGLATGERIESGLMEYVGYAFLGGVLTHSVAALLFRSANTLTDNLGINALAYLTPIFVLVWLAMSPNIGVARPDFVVIGATAIVSANLLINFDTERLLGFKALVISLWVFGTVVYLRDTEGLGWFAKSVSYFDVLFLSSTVFALILSFRIARLASRTQGEDDRAFKLFRELEELAARGVIPPEVSLHIAVMAEKVGKELSAAYIAVRQAIGEALLNTSGPDRERLREAEIDLDILANSRQQGVNFGELCAIFIFAALVVGTALLSHPAEVMGLTGFVVEMFAMLFPAVIVFLAFNGLDIERARVARILEAYPQYQGYGVVFQDTIREAGAAEHTGRRTTEQWISVGIGLALIAAYTGLFLHKWDLLTQVRSAILGPLT